MCGVQEDVADLLRIVLSRCCTDVMQVQQGAYCRGSAADAAAARVAAALSLISLSLSSHLCASSLSSRSSVTSPKP